MRWHIDQLSIVYPWLQVATRVKRDRTFRSALDRWPVLTALLIACLRGGIVAAAEDPDPGKPSTPPSNKLTLAYYDFSSGKGGMDVNLRHTFKSSTGWIGGYHQSDRFDQARMGYEYDYHGDWLTVVPSVQVATRGFLGVTLYGEAGRRFFGIGGMGRTNLRLEPGLRPQRLRPVRRRLPRSCGQYGLRVHHPRQSP
jgi:hypothetical protein